MPSFQTRAPYYAAVLPLRHADFARNRSGVNSGLACVLPVSAPPCPYRSIRIALSFSLRLPRTAPPAARAAARDPTQAMAQDDAKRSSSRPLSAKKRPTLGPRVTPDADTKTPPAAAAAAGVSSNGAHAAAGESGATAAAAEEGGGGAGRVRGRGSVQAPGVSGSQGGVLAATVEAEVGRGRRPAAPVQEVKEEEPIVLDDLFRKTDAKPALYWLPLSEEEVRGGARDGAGWGSIVCEGEDERG